MSFGFPPVPTWIPAGLFSTAGYNALLFAVAFFQHWNPLSLVLLSLLEVLLLTGFQAWGYHKRGWLRTDAKTPAHENQYGIIGGTDAKEKPRYALLILLSSTLSLLSLLFVLITEPFSLLTLDLGDIGVAFLSVLAVFTIRYRNRIPVPNDAGARFLTLGLLVFFLMDSDVLFEPGARVYSAQLLFLYFAGKTLAEFLFYPDEVRWVAQKFSWLATVFSPGRPKKRHEPQREVLVGRKEGTGVLDSCPYCHAVYCFPKTPEPFAVRCFRCKKTVVRLSCKDCSMPIVTDGLRSGLEPSCDSSADRWTCAYCGSEGKWPAAAAAAPLLSCSRQEAEYRYELVSRDSSTGNILMSVAPYFFGFLVLSILLVFFLPISLLLWLSGILGFRREDAWLAVGMLFLVIPLVLFVMTGGWKHGKKKRQ